MRAIEPVGTRLALRELTDSDLTFLVGLYNQPDFLRFIGDRGIRTEGDASNWLRSVTRPLYAQGRGLGMRGVMLADGTLVGVCGLLKREHLPDPDLGYALRTGQAGHGYAREAAGGLLSHALKVLGYTRVLAIVDPDNRRSVHLLEAIGMRRAGDTRHPGEVQDLALYAATA